MGYEGKENSQQFTNNIVRFNKRYIYKQSENPVVLIILSSLITFLGITLFVFTLRYDPFSGAIGVGPFLIIIGIIMFPYGVNSVYIDDKIIRFVKLRLFLSIIFPIKTTFHLDSKLTIHYDAQVGIIKLFQGNASGNIIIRFMDERLKKEILTAIYSLSKAYPKIKITTRHVETLFEDEQVRVPIGTNVMFEYKFQAKDYLLGSFGMETDEPFSYKLFDQKNYDAFKKREKSYGMGKDDVLESDIDWTIETEGIYYLVIDNLKGQKELIALIDLERMHKSKTNEDDFVPAKTPK